MSVPPDIRLVGSKPVSLGFGLKVGDGITHANELEEESPYSAHGRLSVGFSLIKPVYCRPEGCPVFVDVEKRRSLRGDGDTGDTVFVDSLFVP